MSQVSRISINLDPFLRSLNELERHRFPHAEAIALNETAFLARARLVGDMPRKFDIRNSRVLKGYRVGKAQARQPIRQASVFHLDPWMAIHEWGGEKRSTTGKALGVPALETQTKGRAPSGKIRTRWWPRNLRKDAGFADPRAAGRMGGRGNRGKGNPRPFLLRSKDGAVTIVRRYSRGNGAESRAGENRFNLVDLYYLKRAVHVRPRWDFAQTVHQVAAKELGPQLQRALFMVTAFRGQTAPHVTR